MQTYRFDENSRAYLESLPVPMAIYQYLNKRVHTLLLTDGFRDLFEFDELRDAYAVMESDMYSTAHPDDAARMAEAAYRFATEGGRYEVVYRLHARKSGGYKIIHAIGEHVFLASGERLAYVWYTDEGSYTGDGGARTELSETFRRALQEESMVHQARYDALTGLPNMGCFFDLAETARQRMTEQGNPIAILYTNLSGLKLLNSKHGFAEGDRLLQAFARLLARQFGSDNCGRFGQDHFAVYTQAEDLENRIRQLMADAALLNAGRTLPVHIGVYLDEAGQDSIAMACDKASYACDALAESYGSCYRFFDEGMLAEAVERRYFVDNLDRALAEGWIKVYYQAIIRAANGCVCDEEALARWDDPERGMLPPARFIPALEEARLLYRLDLYVVDEILRKLKTLQEAGLFTVPVSVNLSRYDFEACDIVEEIRRRVDEAGVSREMLTIEITESVIGSDFDFMKQQVERFRALGFHVWMDDFGSGYSSLDVLQSIRFDVIKLDMRFMQEFSRGEQSRVILTELVKMAIGLGIDTVCEGVETEEEVEFLREIGCTKLQGFYYIRPIPLEEIMRRYREGSKIGFENPAEREYYVALGRVNLYDLNMMSQGEQESFRNYFNTVPMAVIETDEAAFKLVRCNNSYRSFMLKMFGVAQIGVSFTYAFAEGMTGFGFLQTVRRCGQEGNRMVIDEEMADGSTAHAFIKRIAVNPVTGTAAVAVAVLAVMDEKRTDAVSYALVARALSSNYFNLFYVDLESEHFSEFSSDAAQGELSVERHGENFFTAARTDARRILYEADQEEFIRSFTKENVVRALEEDGAFTTSYRQYYNGQPVYVSMKAVRMKQGDSHIIIGVSNVDTQMRQKQALERARAEQTTYSRITALSADYICIYTVDPETDHFAEYSATRDYESLGLLKEGEDFFNVSLRESERTIHPEDREMFRARFSKEQIMRRVRGGGSYSLRYRLLIDGAPVYVRARAVLVEEEEGPKLILGVSNIDEQVRRDLEYEQELSRARQRDNIDKLTGVRNRRGYLEAEADMDRRLSGGEGPEFAVVIFKLRDRSGSGRAGESEIRSASNLVCETFKHSPVFRTAEDRFTVIAHGRDYENLDALVRQLSAGGDAMLSCGASRFEGEATMGAVHARAEAALKASKA